LVDESGTLVFIGAPSLKKLRKKEYRLYLNRGTTFSFLGLGEVILRKNVGNKSNEKSIHKN
jgi:hypothetical protein